MEIIIEIFWSILTIQFKSVVYKKACELEFTHCFLINFTYAKFKVDFFILLFDICT